MGDDELREKCRAMTRDELIDKHIDIEGIKDAAVYILLFIEDVIKELRTDWCCEFEGKQDLKDLMEKYKEPLPETRKMAEKQAMIEKDGSITPAPDDYEFTEADELPL